jgi:hypothetical protein
MFKKVINTFVLGLLAFSTQAISNEDAFVTKAKAFHIDANTGMYNTLHVNMPEKGVLVLTVDKKDKIKKVESNTNKVGAKLFDNTATITTDKEGLYPIAIITECGLSLSLVIHSINKGEMVDNNFKPKIMVDNLEGCNYSAEVTTSKP